jgi:phosphopantetheinyl transferase
VRVVEFADRLTVPASALAFVSFEERDGATDLQAHRWLAPAEVAYVRRLTAARRRAAWLAGRLAAKAALERLVPSAPACAIEVLPAAGGEPVVRGLARWGGALEVSISHTRNLAVAIAFDRHHTGATGVDVEVCDQEVDPALADLAFSPEERQAIDGHGPSVVAGEAVSGDRLPEVLCFWTAKEAALKAVRRGLRLPLSAVQLTWDECLLPIGASVQCAPDVQAQFGVRTVGVGGHVLSIARETRR